MKRSRAEKRGVEENGGVEMRAETIAMKSVVWAGRNGGEERIAKKRREEKRGAVDIQIRQA